MSDKTMFFGTLYPGNKPGTSAVNQNTMMQLVPAPQTGMQATATGYAEVIEFENGGAEVVQAAATHRSYEMEWSNRRAAIAGGLNLIRNYQQKMYGAGLIYWANPMIFEANMLSPQWATPGLIQMGWKSIYDTNPTGYTTAATVNNLPRTSATFNVTNTATPPTGANSIAVVPIHPDMTAYVGFTGTATGTAVVSVRPINQDGSYATVINLTLLAAAGNRTNATFSGTTYKALEIYIQRTSAVASTITLASGMVQQYKTGTSPTLPILHVAGEGDTGLRFTSEAIVETYIAADRQLKGLSISLTEVGAWVL